MGGCMVMLQHEYIAVAPLTYSLIMCSHLSHTNASIIFCSCQCFTPFSTQFFFSSVYTASFTYRFFSQIWTHRPSTKSLPHRPLTWHVRSLGTGLLFWLLTSERKPTCEAFEAEYCRGKKLFRNKIKNKQTKKTHWWLKINILAIKFMNNVWNETMSWP